MATYSWISTFLKPGRGSSARANSGERPCPGQGADGLRVVLERQTRASGEIARGVNDHLADDLKGMEHVVTEGEVPLKVGGGPHPGPDVA